LDASLGKIHSQRTLLTLLMDRFNRVALAVCRHFRPTPENGHRQAGPVGPVGPVRADSVEKGVLPKLPKILKVAGAVFV